MSDVPRPSDGDPAAPYTAMAHIVDLPARWRWAEADRLRNLNPFADEGPSSDAELVDWMVCRSDWSEP